MCSETYEIDFAGESVPTSEEIDGVINVLSQVIKRFADSLIGNEIGVGSSSISYGFQDYEQLFDSLVVLFKRV